MFYVCTWCRGGAHTHCLGPSCDCLHSHGAWLSPERRAQLRNGFQPRNEVETAFQIAYRCHQEERDDAARRRG